MSPIGCKSTTFAVALLAEGVDRNVGGERLAVERQRVALLAEGVDRNKVAYTGAAKGVSRPPRGGRG